MVLLLSELDTQRLVSMPHAIEQLEEVFRDYAAGSAILAPRTSAALPDGGGAFRVMSAILPKAGFFGLKTLTGTPGKRVPHESYFVVLLFGSETGALRAVIAANYLTGVRTGAASGVAAKYLARQQSRVVGVLGAGVQGWYQIAALKVVCPLEEVRIFDIEQGKAVEFAAKATRELSVHAKAVSQPRDAVAGCDLVVTATSATQPVFDGAWLQEGTHISGVGSNSSAKRELDTTTITRSKIVVDFKEQVMQEAGDIQAAMRAGAIGQDSIYAGVAELVAGTKNGRTSEQEITLFKSVGVAIEDIAIATFAYKQALAAGMGQELHVDPKKLLKPLSAGVDQERGRRGIL
jgi:ornithine cyclodeaminase/alanine dehydrogenase